MKSYSFSRILNTYTFIFFLASLQSLVSNRYFNDQYQWHYPYWIALLVTCTIAIYRWFNAKTLSAMKSILPVILLALYPVCILWPQSVPSTKKLMKEINASLNQKEEGVYKIQTTFKSSSSYDTTFLEAEVFYWRSRTKMDSIGDFILFMDGKIQIAFQHDTLYLIDHNNKELNIQYTGINGVMTYLEGNYKKDFIFMPFVMKREDPIKPYFFENAAVKDTVVGNRRCILLTKIDSFAISPEQKINEDDPDTGSYIFRYLFSSDMTELICLEIWIYTAKVPQYQRFDLSTIRTLEPAEKFSNLFRTDTFIQNGYTITEVDFMEEVEEEETSLTDTVFSADCIFTTLDGDSVLLSGLSGNLILLDYWYMSCAPCRKSMPALYKLHEAYHEKGLRIYGINPVDKTEHIKRFQSEKKTPYALLAGGADCTDSLGVNGYPTFVLIDNKSKKILYYAGGFSETLYEELSVIIEEALTNKN